MNKPKKTYSEEYKANRRKNQRNWLAKKRLNNQWVFEQKKIRNAARGYQMTTTEPEAFNFEAYSKSHPAPTSTEEIKQQIANDEEKISRLRDMYDLFISNSRDQAGIKRRDHINGQETKPIDLMKLVDEFKYQLYVTTLNKDGDTVHLGPFCSPSQARTIVGGLKSITALNRALQEASVMRNTKRKK